MVIMAGIQTLSKLDNKYREVPKTNLIYIINIYNMKINIFILCYNEGILLPHTIAHYRKYLPSAIITIYDNKSSDNSVELAKSLNCNVISWDSNGINNENLRLNIKNTCWKIIEDGWIIVIDMDEWLCITEKELLLEENRGTTILNVKGIDIIGESNKNDLSDIDLHSINRGIDNNNESKKLCFFRKSINEMKYNYGAHQCNPKGRKQYSKKIYINKHMNNLGLPYYIDKMVSRYERSVEMQKVGLSIHYTNNIEIITDKYNKLLEKSKIL